MKYILTITIKITAVLVIFKLWRTVYNNFNFSISPDQYEKMTLYEKADYLEELGGSIPTDYAVFFNFNPPKVTLEDVLEIEKECAKADEKLNIFYQRKMLIMLDHAAQNEFTAWAQKPLLK